VTLDDALDRLGEREDKRFTAQAIAQMDARLREEMQRPPVCICGREVLPEHAAIDDADLVRWHLPCALLALVETRKSIAEMGREGLPR
jgi:hypothetical protein